MRRPRYELWAWLALALAAVHCRDRAKAQGPTRDLGDAVSIQGDAGCLEHARLVAQIAAWLGTMRIESEVRVVIHSDASNPQTLAFDVVRGGQKRHRTFKPIPERCEDVHAVIGLGVALALDEQRLQPLFQATPTLPEDSHVASVQLSAARRVLPDTSLGVQLGFELSWFDWLTVRLDAFGHASWNDAIDGSVGRFHVVLVGGSLQACMGHRLNPELRIALCAGGAAGAAHAWGTGYAERMRATGPFVGIRSGLRIEAKVGLRWMLDVEAISAVVSPSFEVERPGGENLIRKPDGTGFVVSLGPAIRF